MDVDLGARSGRGVAGGGRDGCRFNGREMGLCLKRTLPSFGFCSIFFGVKTIRPSRRMISLR